MVIITLFILFLFLCSAYLNYRLIKLVFKFQDQVELSIDKLDTSYQKISKILEIPLGSDERFVRDVINEIKKSRDVILEVANRITFSEKLEQTDDE
jgi:hypothetical protein